jgi:ribosomal protein L1
MSREDHSRGVDAKLQEAESLIWAMLDEQLDSTDMERLAKMIEEDAEIRSRYIDCVQLHVDLREHFGRKAAEQGQGTIVLPNLLPGVPNIPGMPQVTE